MKKNDIYTGAVKAMFSTQDEGIRTMIGRALDAVNEKVKQKDADSLNQALDVFRQAKTEHANNMLKLEGLDRDIIRNEQELQNAQKESAQAAQSWRSRFRALQGVISPEMKAEHCQQVSNRELLEDFTTLKSELVAELKEEKDRTMLDACISGESLIATHHSALSVYAQNEWSLAIQNIPPALLRAFKLRLRTMRREGDEHPGTILMKELGGNVYAQSEFYIVDNHHEPVIAELGFERPELPGVDMSEYKTPTQQNALRNRRRIEQSRLEKEKDVRQLRDAGNERL